MNPFTLAGMVAMFAGMIAARLIGERALSTLSNEDKLKVLDGFAAHRKNAVIPLVAVVFLVIGLAGIPPAFVLYGMLAIAAIFLVYILWRHGTVRRRMHELELPQPFIGACLRGQRYAQVGWLLFLAGLTLSLR